MTLCLSGQRQISSTSSPLTTYISTKQAYTNGIGAHIWYKYSEWVDLWISHLPIPMHANWDLQNPITPDKTGIPTQYICNIRVVAVGLEQAPLLNIFNWVLYCLAKSSQQDHISLPELSVYSNFVTLLIAKVMTLQVGVDANTPPTTLHITSLAHTFRPQKDIKIGGTAPLLNAYANAHSQEWQGSFFLNIAKCKTYI